MAVIVAATGVGGMGAGAANASTDAGAIPEVHWMVEALNWGVLAACPVVLWWLWRKDVIRPGSFSRREKRELAGSTWFVWWAAALLVVFAQALGAALTLELGRGSIDRVSVGATLVGTLCGVGLGLWLLWFVNASAWGARAGLSPRPRARDFGTGVLWLFLCLPIMGVATLTAVLVAEQITGAPTDPLAHESLKQIQEDPWSLESWGLILTAVMLAPVVEEILFRGLVQSGILRLSRRAWPAILGASLLFGAVHVGAVGEAKHALFPLFVFGVCLGVAYERSRRIWVPITMHMLFNALNVALTLVMPRESYP